MKKFLFVLLFLIAPNVAFGQQKWVLSTAATSCTASNTSCLMVTVDPTQGGATLTVTANASGNTISFEASGDGGTTMVALSATPSNSSTQTSSTTGTGTWQVNTAGYTNIYLIMTTLVSGTTTVNIIQSTASARGGSGGGGGGGAVSNCTTFAGVLYQNGTNNQATCGPNLQWFDSVTYGALSVSGELDVTAQPALTGTNFGSITSSIMTANPPAGPGYASVIGDTEATITSPTTDTSSPYQGIVGQGDAEGTGTIAEVIGVQGKGSSGASSGVGTCTLCIGVEGINNVPAIAATAYALHAAAPTTEGTGSITAAEGLHVDNMQTNSPAPTNSTAVHVAAQTNGQKAIVVDGGVNNFTQMAIGSTPTDTVELFNPTAAANGAQQYSPSIHWQGQGWKTATTAASEPIDFISYIIPTQGSSAPTGNWNLCSQVNSAGYGNCIGLSTSGLFSAPSAQINSVIYNERTGNLLESMAAPAIASGFGSTPSIPNNNGTWAFTVNVGTGGTASSGVVTMPTATTGWDCQVTPNGAPQAAAVTYSAPTSATSITLTNYTLTTGVALAWTASTVLQVKCAGY